MKHLSGLDATFLHLETPEMPMHVGALNLFELPPGYEGDFCAEVKRQMAQRLHLASVFTKKLVMMPLDLTNPVWVEDSEVDLDFHIRQMRLPRPGTMAQLDAQVARLHSGLLDRSRPLWEMVVFDGLEGGQAALYMKVHHAALDGQGAVMLMDELMDHSPAPRFVPQPANRAKEPYRPDAGALLGAGLRNTWAQCLRLAKSVPGLVKSTGGLLIPAKGVDGRRAYSLPKGFKLGPRTMLNVSVTNQRVFATQAISLDQAKAVANAFGGKLNDVVLALCGGALKRYLELHRALPERSLVAAVPVSLRLEGDRDGANHVSVGVTSLATDLADPGQRMRMVVESSGAMKDTMRRVKPAIPTDFPSLGVPWLVSALVALYGRSKLSDKFAPIANVSISNVQGSGRPLYLAGRRLTASFPAAMVTHGTALNFAVLSYNGMLHFGVVGCRRAVPDIDCFPALLHEAHWELMAAAGLAETPCPLPETAAEAGQVPEQEHEQGQSKQKPKRRRTA